MPVTTVIGTQWGDEGKGKILDLVADDADLVVRYQGGANAGHTVKVRDEQFIFHLLPSGVLHKNKLNLIGNGVVLDPEALLSEIDELTSAGYALAGRLFVSGRAHVVMPYHKRFDQVREAARTVKIGTTSRGIGPCYTDKMARNGFRLYDVIDFERFRRKLASVLPVKNKILVGAYGADPIDEDEILTQFEEFSARLRPFAADTGGMVRKAIKEDKNVFFEGAQGTLLDIDHGTYPFVTSSNSCALGLPAGAGIPPQSAGRIIGVAKAYTTRVGEGPFPTEGEAALDEALRKAGDEFGATTGRPRRCGWLDGVALRYVSELNGLSALALTKLDVLTGMNPIKVCTAYKIGDETHGEFPADTALLDEVEPLFESLSGWEDDIRGCRTYEGLPAAAREYVAFVEKIAGVRASIISVGPGREETIVR